MVCLETLDNHFDVDCPNVFVECTHCGTMVQRSSLQVHYGELCMIIQSKNEILFIKRQNELNPKIKENLINKKQLSGLRKNVSFSPPLLQKPYLDEKTTKFDQKKSGTQYDMKLLNTIFGS